MQCHLFSTPPNNLLQKFTYGERINYLLSLVGVSDHVLCFSCDGGLKNWEPNDQPWKEHETWFGQCPYLNLMKNDRPQTDLTAVANGATAVAATANGATALAPQCLTESNDTLLNVAPPLNVTKATPKQVVQEQKEKKTGAGSTDSGYTSIEMKVVEVLKEENKRLKDENSCRICYVFESNIVFLPCGHLVTCPQCASAVTTCPVCRTPITQTIRIFKS